MNPKDIENPIGEADFRNQLRTKRIKEPIHIRYTSYSTFLHKKLEEEGFKEDPKEVIGFGMNRVRKFFKDNLIIEDSYQGIYLYAMVEHTMPCNVKKITKTLKYHGLSVNKELLENFANKGIYNI